MNLLLDTHIWLWSLLEPAKLKPRVKRALTAGSNDLWLSPISTWELLVLVEKGRVALDDPVDVWLDEALRRVPMREAPITHEIAIESRRVGLQHNDPADRFLAATAKLHELTLVTADKRLVRAKEFQVMDAS